MPAILLVSANTFKDPYPVYPLGASYIKTYLNANLLNYEVEMFDFNLAGKDDFCSLIREKDFKYVCVSMRNIDDTNMLSKNVFVMWYSQIMQMIREECNSKIIIGGAGYSIFPKTLFEALNPDFGVHGEGEHSLLELINRLDNGKSPDDIEGLVYKDKSGDIHVNERKRFVSSLTLDIDNQLYPFYWNTSGMLNIQTKRGCPHRCIYCSYPVIEGSVVRMLDIKEVVENLKELYYSKGVNYVFFTDSVFNINREYNQELSHSIIESGVKVNWGAYFSPANITYDDLKLYQEAGLTHIEFGSDSFSDTQLDNYRKGFRFRDIERSSQYCYDLGIFYAHFLILGGYGETEQTILETFENCKKIKHSVFFPYIGMRIYPNTELCGIAIKEGIIASEEELLAPTYYLSKDIDINMIETRAIDSGKRWVFPDDTTSKLVVKLRAKKRRGPLWEHLRY